jgi:hypothetical protein
MLSLWILIDFNYIPTTFHLIPQFLFRTECYIHFDPEDGGSMYP